MCPLQRLRGELSGSGGGHPALPWPGEAMGRTSPQGPGLVPRTASGSPAPVTGIELVALAGDRTRRGPAGAVTTSGGSDGSTVHTTCPNVTFWSRQTKESRVCAGQKRYAAAQRTIGSPTLAGHVGHAQCRARGAIGHALGMIRASGAPETAQPTLPRGSEPRSGISCALKEQQLLILERTSDPRPHS